jgi:DNA polymerase-1
MKLLIDADYIVYKACAAAEADLDFGDDVIIVVSKFSEAMQNVRRELANISSHFFNSEMILFFSDSINFRKLLYSDYKGHRNRKKPAGYKRVVNALRDEYEVIVMPTLEADDALGIYATQYPDNVLCSPDKDMRQIPGRLFDMKESCFITPEEGRRWHFIQTLAGDQTDGYAGVPGYGIKTAAKLFEKEGYFWETIVDAFKSKGMTEDDALLNARLAKILQVEDYDFNGSKALSWYPSPTDYRAYNGTEVSAA